MIVVPEKVKETAFHLKACKKEGKTSSDLSTMRLKGSIGESAI